MEDNSSFIPEGGDSLDTGVDSSTSSDSQFDGVNQGELDALDAAQERGDISKQEALILKKQLKLKVDGQEVTEELDWNDEDTLKKHLQKSKAFDKRVSEMSQYKSQVDQLLQMLQTNPEEALERLGIDVDDFSEKRIARKVEDLKKTPEQLEMEKMRKEVEEYKKKESEAKSAAEKAEMERLRNQQAVQIESEISEALDEMKSILPRKNPKIYSKIASTMMLAMQEGYHNVTAKDVLPIVEKEYREELAAILGSSPDEVFEALVGKDRLENYRKARVAAQKQAVKKPTIVDTGVPKSEKKPAEKKRFNDVFKLNKRS